MGGMDTDRGICKIVIFGFILYVFAFSQERRINNPCIHNIQFFCFLQKKENKSPWYAFLAAHRELWSLLCHPCPNIWVQLNQTKSCFGTCIPDHNLLRYKCSLVTQGFAHAPQFSRCHNARTTLSTHFESELWLDLTINALDDKQNGKRKYQYQSANKLQRK